MKAHWKLWLALGILLLLTPLGLLAKGTAWGEWGVEELRRMLGWVPKGMEGLSALWKAKLSGYNLPGWEDPWLARLGYLISALLGVGVVVGLAFILGWLLSLKRGDHGP